MLGLSLDALPFLTLALGLALGLFALTRRQPRTGLVLWLLTLCFVPIWFGVSFIVYFPPASAVGIVVLAGLARSLPRSVGLTDILVGFFFISCLAPMLVGTGTLSTVFGATALWLVAYLIGRLSPDTIPLEWIYGSVAVVFSVVAGLAVIEFVLDWHPFEWTTGMGGLAREWGTIQVRGALARSEGAFGHSIALGASIALAIPLALGSRFRTSLRLAMTVLLVAGVLVTLSRAAIVSAALGIVLTVVFVRSEAVRRVRWPVLGFVGVSALVLAPTLWGFFAGAGDEATRSAAYRARLTQLIPDVNLLGVSRIAYRSPTGEVYFGRFQSIDSQIIFTGLTYGALALALGVLLLGLAVAILPLGTATPATVAIVAQIPTLATVALITQYSMMFWFVAGLAVSSVLRSPSQQASAGSSSRVFAPSLPAPRLASAELPAAKSGAFGGDSRHAAE